MDAYLISPLTDEDRFGGVFRKRVRLPCLPTQDTPLKFNVAEEKVEGWVHSAAIYVDQEVVMVYLVRFQGLVPNFKDDPTWEKIEM